MTNNESSMTTQLPSALLRVVHQEAQRLYSIIDAKARKMDKNVYGLPSMFDNTEIMQPIINMLTNHTLENFRLQQENDKLKEILKWYSNPGNYLDEKGELATAWKNNENIAKKAAEALK